LAELVDKEPGTRAVMIRDSDVYLPPRGRIAVAQQHRDTLLATFRRERHVVRAGETLPEIAARYRVSVDELRSSNELDSDITSSWTGTAHPNQR
jgi:hypothetical protein